MAFAGLCSAISIKLSSSVDDVVWLAPFLTSNVSYKTRIQNACVYIGVCLVQTVIAMVIAYSGDAVVTWLTSNSKDSWSTEKILTVIAGVLLAIYTVKLTYEYFFEDDDEEESGEEKESASASDSEAGHLASQMELGSNSDAVEHELPTLLASEPAHVEGTKSLLGEKECAQEDTCTSQRHAAAGDQAQIVDGSGKRGTAALFVIAFLGSVDDLTLFVPMLVGKGFTCVQLISGAIIAAFTIVMICLFIGLCKPVANFLSSIPLALIVGIFSTSLLVKGFTMQ